MRPRYLGFREFVDTDTLQPRKCCSRDQSEVTSWNPLGPPVAADVDDLVVLL